MPNLHAAIDFDNSIVAGLFGTSDGDSRKIIISPFVGPQSGVICDGRNSTVNVDCISGDNTAPIDLVQLVPGIGPRGTILIGPLPRDIVITRSGSGGSVGKFVKMHLQRVEQIRKGISRGRDRTRFVDHFHRGERLGKRENKRGGGCSVEICGEYIRK